MSTLIACPGCQHKLTLPDDFAGRRVQCPVCALDFAASSPGVASMEVDPLEKRLPEAPATPASPVGVPPSAYEPAGGARRRATTPSASPTIFCQECGAKFPRDDDACPACGHLRHEADNIAMDQRPRFRRLPIISGVLPILGLVLFGLGVISCVVGPIVYGMVPRHMRWVGEITTAIGCTAGGLAILGALACMTAWLYQAWRLVLHGDEDYSAGLMVGLLFIPFFNFYWMFRAIPGLSVAIQDELRHLAPARNHNAGWVVGLLACIFLLIPYLQPVAFCIFVAWMLLANNAIHRLIQYHERLADETYPEQGPPASTASGPR